MLRIVAVELLLVLELKKRTHYHIISKVNLNHGSTKESPCDNSLVQFGLRYQFTDKKIE